MSGFTLSCNGEDLSVIGISEAVIEVSKAIKKSLGGYLKTPKSEAEWLQISKKFEQRWMGKFINFHLLSGTSFSLDSACCALFFSFLSKFDCDVKIFFQTIEQKIKKQQEEKSPFSCRKDCKSAATK